MSAPSTFCPRCRTDQLVIGEGGFCQCPVCRLEFRQSPPLPGAQPDLATEAISVARIILRVLLIMAAIVVVTIGVLFAGCALVLGGGHF